MLRVIVPSYNCEEWLDRCLESINKQMYRMFTVTIIDDCSSDGQYEIALKYVTRYEHWDYVRNGMNMGAIYNIYQAIGALEGPSDVVLIVDGDDFLPHERVFARVAELYEDPALWLMWTQYAPFPYYTTLIDNHPLQCDPSQTSRTQQPSAGYTLEEGETPGFFRSSAGHYNHVLTFRKFLFDLSVEESDVRLPNGRWPKAGYDRAMMVPMLERCGWGHMRFVDEVMYCYNSVNPNSDVSVRLDEAKLAYQLIDSIPPKSLLSEEEVAKARACSAL